MKIILSNLIKQALKEKVYSPRKMHKLKIQYVDKYKIPFPADLDLIEVYRELIGKKQIQENPPDLLLKPNLETGMLNFDKVPEIIEFGREFMIKNLPQVKKLLN